MSLLVNVAAGTWAVMAHMAPYLLLGFAAAGLLHVFLTAALVKQHLGRGGLWQIVKATLFGIPLPLCSCGVIPVAASLRTHGASRGTTVSFLASTPQTGVDSILVTYGLMGPVFTVFRVLAAFVTGVLSGIGVEWLAPETPAEASQPQPAQQETPASRPPAWRRFLQHGFVTLPRDIGRAVLLGLLISGVLGAVIPADFFADRIGQGFLSLLVMLAIGIPFYVCSTASIPIAFSLLHAGISPGGALVFLIAGPATNAATVLTLWSIIGRRATLVYLAAIAVCALGSGLMLDRILPAAHMAEHLACHTAALAPWQHGAAIALLALLAGNLIAKYRRAP